jgi:death on curing protein
MATKIRWLTVREVHAFHDNTLSEHGGLPGLRAAGLLESAVSRARMAYDYGVSDLAELAAKLAFGIISNHAFLDGNKRTALLASATFLLLNGKRFTAAENEALSLMIDVANDELSEEELIGWYKSRTISAQEFDRLVDENKEDVTLYLNLKTVRRPGVNVTRREEKRG